MRRILLAVALAVLLAGCGEVSRWWRTGPVGKAMSRELREQAAAEIDLRALTRFAWDELFVFAAPTTPRDVCVKLRLAKEGCDRNITMTSIRADETLLVFREGGKVAHVELLLRDNGDFARSLHLMPFKREQSTFLVTARPRTPGEPPQLFLFPRHAFEQRNQFPESGAIQFLPGRSLDTPR